MRDKVSRLVLPWDPWGARGRKLESCRPDQYLRHADGISVVPSVRDSSREISNVRIWTSPERSVVGASADQFPKCFHVNLVGLAGWTDLEIWACAREHALLEYGDTQTF
jgi:hypothetical protein